MSKFLTEKEIDNLQAFRNKGGIFLKIYAKDDRVEILSSDGKFGYKPLQELDRVLAFKVKEVYFSQNEYNAPLKDGAYEVSLAWFVVKFSCW